MEINDLRVDRFGLRFTRNAAGALLAEPTTQFILAWFTNEPHMRALGYRVHTESGPVLVEKLEDKKAA